MAKAKHDQMISLSKSIRPLGPLLGAARKTGGLKSGSNLKRKQLQLGQTGRTDSSVRTLLTDYSAPDRATPQNKTSRSRTKQMEAVKRK